jgi:K(+)-stimulated pyrophosphate-energized sodium pump
MAPIVALIGLLVALGLYRTVVTSPTDNGEAAVVARRIRSGALVFLRHEYSRLLVFLVIIAAALAFWLSWESALAFVGGAVSSAIAGGVGMWTATRANVRTAVAARDHGRGPALAIAFFGGSVMGLAVAALGLLGLGTLFLILQGSPHLAQIMTGFGMGASSVALFARVGGGIFTKSADVGADMVGKVEAGIAEDDPRNPGVIADNVGDNVGDVAGMGADIFESYCSSIIAAIAIAAAMPVVQAEAMGGRVQLLFLPLALAAAGLISSIIAIGAVRLAAKRSPEFALGMGVVVATVLFLAGAAGGLLYFGISMNTWLAVVAGTVAGITIGGVTEFYTKGKPVRRLANSSSTGAATVIIMGLSLGMESMAVPVLALGLAMYLATAIAGLYGVALAAVGMLATAGMVMAIDAYGPIADNAGGIAEMTGMGEETRAITDDLDELGNTTAAIGKGFAIGAAALAALALMSAYVETVGHRVPDFTLHLADPKVLLGMFIGSLLPFLFSAMTMTAVGEAAGEMIVEIRRQFQEIPGLREGKAKPDSDRCTAIATNAALRRMIAPGSMAVVTPVAVGLILGPEALGGLLGGAVITGVVLALVMANAGGAWDNAKKFIEKGNLGGKGSPAHAASIVGDTVGDPFKDTSGPSMNILIKVLAIVSLTIAPLLG